MNQPTIQIANKKPEIVVVDNFLTNPEEHREFAMTLDYAKQGSYGVRSREKYAYPEYRDAFEHILQRKIVGWENRGGGVNGVYQWCNKHQDLVYHVDNQMYAAMIYLTPNAPVATGTSFWKSRNSGVRVFTGPHGPATFGPKGEYLKDESQFELVDKVGNIYNRLVLFYGKCIHSASAYFGEDIHDSRLFQIFFFNCETES